MTSTVATPAATRKRPGKRPQSGPPLLAPVLAFTALTVGYVVANHAAPHPDASAASVLAYDHGHGTAIRVGAALMLGSAIPLALLAAVLYRRLRALGISAPGSAITLVGGIGASAMLMLCATVGYGSGRLAGDASPALAKALDDLSFFSGGPAFAATFALLIAGVSMSAYKAWLVSRAVTVPGLVIAFVGMLAVLSPVASGFAYLVPVVRFGGMVWLVAVAALLPRTRPWTIAAT